MTGLKTEDLWDPMKSCARILYVMQTPISTTLHHCTHFKTTHLLLLVFLQDVKKAVLEDMKAEGKTAGLKSFEQVRSLSTLVVVKNMQAANLLMLTSVGIFR